MSLKQPQLTICNLLHFVIVLHKAHAVCKSICCPGNHGPSFRNHSCNSALARLAPSFKIQCLSALCYLSTCLQPEAPHSAAAHVCGGSCCMGFPDTAAHAPSLHQPTRGGSSSSSSSSPKLQLIEQPCKSSHLLPAGCSCLYSDPDLTHHIPRQTSDPAAAAAAAAAAATASVQETHSATSPTQTGLLQHQ
eukprot:1152822-Pelagomonas_calceolata.AAC.4